MNYKKLKLKAGLEIHQQLDTHKLFCSCPSLLRNDEPKLRVTRKLNPVVGETGKIDSAAQYEKTKNKTFEYLVHDTNCLVELDEEPPHDLNPESLKIALQIALLLNCKIFPVTQIMRKTVIDGSNTGGFQRTVLIAHDGFIETSKGKIRIETIALEEDSARPVLREENKVIYNLDRLGIPLVEITTMPDLKSPENIKEAALKIGEILRACKVKRGIGTIRQDVNISIEGGQRTEIKGFQDPKIFVSTVENEMQRQYNLLKLKDKFKKLKLGEVKDLSQIFKNTNCKFVKKALLERKGVFGFIVKEGESLIGKEIQPNKRIGTEFSDFSKPLSKVGGIIHSDEKLEKYDFTNEEIKQTKEFLKLEKQDAFILIVGTKKQAELTLDAIFTRIKQFSQGVPKEVRQSNPDSTTSFLRPMPGEARMYPETDCQLLKIKKQQIDELKRNLPKLASENKRYLQEFGLNEELVKILLKSRKVEEFKELTNQTDHYDLIVKSLVIFPKELSKKENLTLEETEEILNIGRLSQLLSKVPEEISPNQVKSILHKLLQGKSLEQALEKKDINLTEEVQKLIKEKPNLSRGAYMGLLMNKYAGIVTGKEVNEELSKYL